ncbi:hypothetical protein [Bacteroides congonensis]|uniref:hypothetical protein n=1 Tax=Bacteroides congonensis TaxID=1871006 RepID=UPI003A86B54C
MDTPNLDLHFENLLYMGRNVLDNTSDYIRKRFSRKEMCVYEYLFKEETSKGIEIVVDDATLVCVFDNDICKQSILYLNDPLNIVYYINYCNDSFEYDKKLDKWLMSDSYLTLFIPNDDSERRLAFIQTLV